MFTGLNASSYHYPKMHISQEELHPKPQVPETKEQEPIAETLDLTLHPSSPDAVREEFQRESADVQHMAQHLHEYVILAQDSVDLAGISAQITDRILPLQAPIDLAAGMGDLSSILSIAQLVRAGIEYKDLRQLRMGKESELEELTKHPSNQANDKAIEDLEAEIHTIDERIAQLQYNVGYNLARGGLTAAKSNVPLISHGAVAIAQAQHLAAPAASIVAGATAGGLGVALGGAGLVLFSNKLDDNYSEWKTIEHVRDSLLELQADNTMDPAVQQVLRWKIQGLDRQAADVAAQGMCNAVAFAASGMGLGSGISTVLVVSAIQLLLDSLSPQIEDVAAGKSMKQSIEEVLGKGLRL